MDSLSTVLLSLALAAGIGALLLPAMPQIKGRIGEWLVHHRLRSVLPAAYYTIFHDVRIRHSGAAGSAVVRLDHVVVSPYGIFVIRSRHWSGWLFGAERDAEWTRLVIRSRRRVSNPLRECLVGVDALCGVLDLEPGLFHPMVVLTGGAEFRTPLPANVTPLGGMLPFIQVRSRETLGFEAAQQAARRIESIRLRPGPQTRAAQLAELRREQSARFSPRQATSALACMLAMLSVAGLLIQNLTEIPGRFPSDRPGLRQPSLGDAPPPRIELPVTREARRNQAQPASGDVPSRAAALPGAPQSATSPPAAVREEAGREREVSLVCAWSAEAGRCTCYGAEGRETELSFDRCRALADSSPGAGGTH